MFEPSPDRFPCSTGASAPRPRPARTRTASSPCRSKRSASSDTTRACPYLLSISLARAARRGFFLLVYISVHLANTATKRAAGSEVSSFKKPAGRRPLSLNLRRAARPGSSRRVDGTAPLGRTLAADSYDILLLTSRYRYGPQPVPISLVAQLNMVALPMVLIRSLPQSISISIDGDRK